MSLYEAWTGSSGDVWLGSMWKFRLVKELNSVTNWHLANFSIIADLPSDLLKPRRPWKRTLQMRY